VSDLNALAKVHADLLRSPTLVINGPAVWRYVMALSDEHDIGADKDKVWLESGKPNFQAFRRFVELNPEHVSDVRVYPWLRNCSVLFLGVPATVLGQTPISLARGSSYSVACDVLFSRTLESFAQSPIARSVYVPFPPVLVEASYPGWIATGRTVNDFFEYCRSEIRDPLDVVPLSFGQIVGSIKYRSIEIFPQLDSSLIGYPLRLRTDSVLEGYRVFSIVRVGNACVVQPFQHCHWRTSIWEFNGTWGFLIGTSVLSLLMKDYSFFAAEALPWDTSASEVDLFEKKFPFQPQLRDWFRSSYVLLDSDLSRVYFGKSCRTWVNVQQEFRVVRNGSGYLLRLSQNFHPSGVSREKYFSLLLQASRLSYSSGYDLMKRSMSDYV
jgi:hypothetical protein